MVNSEHPQVRYTQGSESLIREVDLNDIARDLNINEYLRCMGLEVVLIAHDSEGMMIEMEQTSKTESERCKEMKAWTESEVRSAALELQLQMRYWEEEQKRKAILQDRMKQYQKQDEL